MENDYNLEIVKKINADIASLKSLLADVKSLQEKRRNYRWEWRQYKKNIKKFRPRLKQYDKEKLKVYKKDHAEEAPKFPVKTAVITVITVVTLPKMVIDGKEYAKEKGAYDAKILREYNEQHAEIRSALEQEDNEVLKGFEKQLEKAKADYEYYQDRVDASRIIGNRYKEEEALERIIELLESRDAVNIEQAIQIWETEELEEQIALMSSSDDDDD